MIILIARLICGIVATIAIVLAARHITMRWQMRGKEYLTAFLIAVAIDNLVTGTLILIRLSVSTPIVITWQTIALLAPQIAVTLTAMAFCGLLLGIIGGDHAADPHVE